MQRYSRYYSFSNGKRESSLSHPDPAPDSPSAALVSTHSPYLLTTYSRPPLVFVRGKGSYLWDLENRYQFLLLKLTQGNT